jgi:molybdopterin-binding protein
MASRSFIRKPPNDGEENHPPVQSDYGGLMLSARNQLKGTVKALKLGTVMAEVVVTIGDNEIVAVITRTSVERMGLKEGAAVTVMIKATEVMLSND